jgi:hypothetical protein
MYEIVTNAIGKALDSKTFKFLFNTFDEPFSLPADNVNSVYSGAHDMKLLSKCIYENYGKKEYSENRSIADLHGFFIRPVCSYFFCFIN